MDAVAFKPLKFHQHGLSYTALSRVHDIHSLYLVCKLEHINFKTCKKVEEEMQFLHTLACWKIQYSLQSTPPDYFTLCSLNT